MMLEGVPNIALAVGYTNASWTLKCDLTCEYVMPAAQPHATTRAAAVHAGQPRCIRPVAPLLELTSGYVQRSADRFPKQGSKVPWQVHQSYLRDYRALKMSGSRRMTPWCSPTRSYPRSRPCLLRQS